MQLSDLTFRRKWSATFFKNRRMAMGEMSFNKDFVHTTRGDMYPVLEKNGNYEETVDVALNTYTFRGEKDAFITRLLGQYFPSATYELAFLSLGEAGLTIDGPLGKLRFTVKNDGGSLTAVIKDGEKREEHPLSVPFKEGMKILVTCRAARWDLYSDCGSGRPYHECSYTEDAFGEINKYDVFSKTTAGVTLAGETTLSACSFFLDSGISQADIRPIRYENGDVMVDEGKVYFTISARGEAGGYQGVLSWVPGTEEVALTGAIFYDAGDGKWCSDVAASILYHRAEKRWLLWVCSFSHGHVLAHASFTGDPRFGANVIDVSVLPEDEAAPLTDFVGKSGDEDPDFFYDEEKKIWHMVVCRIGKEKRYQYHFFESKEPFAGFRFVGAGAIDGAETGGSFVRFQGKTYFVCGNDFNKRADYRVYDVDDLPNYKKLMCDFDDGGFRGWGTIVPVVIGSRKRYFWLTFDRFLGSEWNWSYGSLYCFEADYFEKNV